MLLLFIESSKRVSLLVFVAEYVYSFAKKKCDRKRKGMRGLGRVGVSFYMSE